MEEADAEIVLQRGREASPPGPGRGSSPFAAAGPVGCENARQVHYVAAAHGSGNRRLWVTPNTAKSRLKLNPEKGHSR
jgi:hypothetical protein